MSLILKEDSPLYGTVKSAEEGRRKFKGVWIPRSIWTNPDLSWLEKCLWAEIGSLSTKEEPCFASNGYLAKMMCSTEKSVSNMVANLKSKGLIVIVSFDGRNRQMIAVEAPPTGGCSINPQVDIDTRLEGSSSLHSEEPSSVPVKKPTMAEIFSASEQGKLLQEKLDLSTTDSGEAEPKAQSIVDTVPASLITRTQSELAKSRYRLCRMFNRKTSLPWSAKEETALRKIVGTDEEDWLALEEYYKHKGEDVFYCRTAIITLLNNWGQDITKAHESFGRAKPQEEDLSRFMVGAPKRNYR